MSEPVDDGPFGGPSDLFNTRLWWSQIRTAAGLFVRFNPFGRGPVAPAQALASAARAFPVVGAGLGFAGGIAYAILFGIGLPPLIAALAGVGALVLLTGALHETQLSRFAERLGSGVEARLGAAGVIALLMALGARIATVADLERPGLVIAALVCAGAVSRAALPALVRYLPALVRAQRAQAPGRADPSEAAGEEPRSADRTTESEAAAEGEQARAPEANREAGETAGNPPPLPSEVWTGAAIAALLSLIALGWPGLAALLAGVAGAFALAFLTRRRAPLELPDALGAAQQSGEIFFLIALAAIK